MRSRNKGPKTILKTQWPNICGPQKIFFMALTTYGVRRVLLETLAGPKYFKSRGFGRQDQQEQ